MIERVIAALSGTREPDDVFAVARQVNQGDEARKAKLDSGLTPAAVLVPLVERDGEWRVVLTKRSSKLRHHPGQISFPGGRRDDGDQTFTHTATREANEEIALPTDAVEVIGYLDPYITITDYLVQPVVAVISPDAPIVPDGVEATEIIEAPLAVVTNPANHQRQNATVNDRRTGWYVIQYQQHSIWGATAGMLVNLSSKLA